MGAKRLGLAIFDALRATAALGAILGTVAFVGGFAVAWTLASNPCAGPSDLQACREARWTWGAVATAVGLLGAFLLSLFVPVVVAAGGPRRRGRRWALAHASSLAQARGWLADGRVPGEAFDQLAERHRRHERGETEGEAWRAAGACLATTGLVAALGASGAWLAAGAVHPDEPFLPALRLACAVLLLVAVVGLGLGLPGWVAGRQAANTARAGFDTDLDRLAHLAAASARNAASTPGKSRQERGKARAGATSPLK